MTHDTQHFSSDDINTQLDTIKHQFPSYTTSDTQLVHTLQQHFAAQAHQEAAILSRVQQRLAHVQQEGNTQHEQNQLPIQMFVPTIRSIPAAKKAKTLYPGIRILSTIAAAILIITLVGSFWLVFHAAQRTQTAMGGAKKTNQHTVASPTPGTAQLNQTACLNPGTVRVPDMPAITGTTNQNIVYSVDNDNLVLLQRFNTTTQQTTTIFQATQQQSVGNTQISPDGQWVFFETEAKALRFVRVDGQYEQTLYCAPQGSTVSGVRISPDQKSLVVALQRDKSHFELLLLNLVNGGQAQFLLTTPNNANIEYQPTTWLDNQRIYLLRTQNGSQRSLVLLDTSKGSDQQDQSLQNVVSGIQTDAFDISPDHSTIVSVQCASGQSNCKIIAQSATGGQSHIVYTGSANQTIFAVRMASNSRVLFIPYSTDTQMHGLWSVNLDGSQVKPLFNDPGEISIDSRFTADGAGQLLAIISPDGSMYVDAKDYHTSQATPTIITAPDGNKTIVQRSIQTGSLVYGSVQNGTPIVALSHASFLNIVGWAKA